MRPLFRTAIVVLVGLVVAAVAGPGAVARQGDPGAGGPLGPHVGDRVRVANDDREEIAVLSVIELADPFARGEAANGYRAVMADVVFENVGADSTYVEGAEFAAVDADGFVYDPDDSAEFYVVGDPAATVYFGGTVEPGETIGVRLVFQLPLYAVLAQIVYDRSIPLVDLRQDRPGYGDSVPFVLVGGAKGAAITVSTPTDPYVPPEPEPDEDGIVTTFVLTDERYVVFPVAIENTGDHPFSVDPRDFYVADDQGDLTQEQPRGEAENDPAGPFLQSTRALPPGETAAGLIKFLLRDDAVPVAVVYSPVEPTGNRLVTVAESGVRPIAPVSQPIDTSVAEAPAEPVEEPPYVTPGCEGVFGWLQQIGVIMDDATGPGLEALPEDEADIGATDPAVFRQAAADLRAIAAELAWSAPPAAAADYAATVVALYNLMADGMDRIADAVEIGDQAAIEAAYEQIGEEVEAFLDGEFDAAIIDLAEVCPETAGL
jgi:hypothetical protein